MMVVLIFSFAILCATLILILALSSFLSKSFQFWPPPTKSSWQYDTFWLLFRCVLISIIILSIFNFNSLGFWQHYSRVYFGLLLAIVGLSFAFLITYSLGWENAHGTKENLVINGWYTWSRNPIYVVSIFGFAGWALAVNSIYVYILFAFIIGFYIFAPFLEEPWLEEVYAESYLAYKNKVPRFLGFQKNKPFLE